MRVKRQEFLEDLQIKVINIYREVQEVSLQHKRMCRSAGATQSEGMHALLLLLMAKPAMQDCWVPVFHAILVIALSILVRNSIDDKVQKEKYFRFTIRGLGLRVQYLR